MKRVRVLTPHDPKRNWHQWVHLGDRVWRDSLGRPNNGGSYRWLNVVCNNLECPGEALVSARALEELITQWIEEV